MKKNNKNDIWVESTRLLLRKVTQADFSYFQDYLTNKEYDRLMLRTPCDTEEDIRLGFDWFLNKEERAYVIENKANGSVIGNLTVYNSTPSIVANHEMLNGKTGRSLSFAIAKKYQRQGFMYEAVYTAISYLFSEEKVDYINCGYLSYNEPSKKLQEKLGFVYFAKEDLIVDGKIYTAVENILWKS